MRPPIKSNTYAIWRSIEDYSCPQYVRKRLVVGDIGRPLEPMRTTIPRQSSVGGGSVAADAFLFASVDDRNALATTAGGIVLAVCICTLKPILAATSARSISLPRPAIVNGAPLSETKVKAGLAARFSTRSARKSILEQSENYTVSSSAAN